MYQEVNFNDFVDAFRQMGREDNFSYEGKQALFDHLEQLEEDSGEEIELDIIAICCEYSEYESLEKFQKDYGEEYETIEDIEESTTVIKINEESFIISNF